MVDLTRYRGIIDDWPRFVKASLRPEPTVCRVRAGRCDQEEILARLGAQGFELRPLSGQPTFYQVERGPHPVSLTLEHWLGLLYVQQASTGVAAPALGASSGERVLDLCAAPGGKTTHLAEIMADRGCLVASEVDERRIRGLLGNVYRLAHSNVLVVSCDGRAFPEGALFDRVLVDAPCSGEGTLRRRSGEPPNQSRSFLGYVTRLQRALLKKAIRLVRPGGSVLYVTCTFAPEENEAVVSDVLASEPVELEPLELPVPHAPGLTSFEGSAYDGRLVGAARIYPHHFDSGGLFLARLRRLDGDAGEGRWARPPFAFPGDAADEEEARTQVREAVDSITDRYGIVPPAHWRWILRGGRIWLHSVDAWPLDGWPEGAWRPVSVGIRAIEFDSRRRPRPTNDLLRLAGRHVETGVVDIDGQALGSMLGGEPWTVDYERRGPVALRLGPDVIGRGAATAEGVKAEIPKARAAELTRILSGRQTD